MSALTIRGASVEKLVWGFARVVAAVLGLLSLSLGALCFGVFAEFGGWWAVGLGSAFVSAGLWLLWASLWGSRALIDRIVTDSLIKLVEKLF
jgi:hypothetical protein